jgi:hypothetical protein
VLLFYALGQCRMRGLGIVRKWSPFMWVAEGGGGGGNDRERLV